MKMKQPSIQIIPLGMVGSTKFGRYPKISVEKTYNMIISDNFLVPYAGYKNVLNILPTGKGRGLFNSSRFNHMIAVVDNSVYTIDKNLILTFVGNIDTSSGDVFIDENDNRQIAICDKSNIYIYNYSTNILQKATTGFTPGYVAFQDGYFIAPDITDSPTSQPNWRLSQLNNGLAWTPTLQGQFQTKPDNCIAAVRMPGRGGQLFIFGNTVIEPWTDVGSLLFPYKKNTSFNIDYGCLNPSTIATSDTFVIWLGTNEKSGPAIMYSSGGDITQISNDGINFKLSQLEHPEKSYGFLFKQDGHLIYQITFNDPSDNVSFIYDFNTQMFFSVCDPDMNFHIARRLVYFNNTYYFLSFIDGNLYQMDSIFTDFNGKEMINIRVCPTVRLPDSSAFIGNSLNFIMEQGTSSTISRVDMSMSYDGGEMFGNYVEMKVNALGSRRNRITQYNLGYANEITPQFRFWGLGRQVVGDGTIEIYQ